LKSFMGDLLSIPSCFGIEIYRLEAGFATRTATGMPPSCKGGDEVNSLK